MFYITKKEIIFGIIGIFFMFIVQSCDNTSIPVDERGCDWVEDSISAVFINASLYPASDDCDMPFYSSDWEVTSPISGIYELMNDISNGTMSSFHEVKFSWITSIYTRKCDYIHQERNSSRVELDENNYNTRLFALDLLEYSPLLLEANEVLPEDYKHQLVIQVPHVLNEYNMSEGTLTWTNTWLAGENISIVSNVWGFECPINGMYATFTPDFGYERYIYINGSFTYIR